MERKNLQFGENLVNEGHGNVLLLENIHGVAQQAFETHGYAVETMPGALGEDELCQQVEAATILGIRSNTHVTEKVLSHADKLQAIGAFCIGTNQIDLSAATERGIAVFNAPFSNTRAVAELAIGEVLALSRRLMDKNDAMHRGEWDKSATGSHEVRGQRLGIVGYGNIGMQVSILAEAIGIQVQYYDIADKLSIGNAKPTASLEELLKTSDIVTVHVDGDQKNRGLFGEAEFAAMNDGALFLNLSRGEVVDVAALKKHLLLGRLGGAALDVFPSEPKTSGQKFQSELQGLPNVILTPHIGAGTEEAQEDIGHFVAEKLVRYSQEGSTAMSVNLPRVQPMEPAEHRLTLAHRNVPGVLASVNGILAAQDVNVVGQYLGTNADTGYAIIDVANELPDSATQQIRDLPATTRLRVLG